MKEKTTKRTRKTIRLELIESDIIEVLRRSYDVPSLASTYDQIRITHNGSPVTDYTPVVVTISYDEEKETTERKVDLPPEHE